MVEFNGGFNTIRSLSAVYSTDDRDDLDDFRDMLDDLECPSIEEVTRFHRGTARAYAFVAPHEYEANQERYDWIAALDGDPVQSGTKYQIIYSIKFSRPIVSLEDFDFSL